jgi:hypothetical protein
MTLGIFIVIFDYEHLFYFYILIMLLSEDFVINSNHLFKKEAKRSLSIPCLLSCLWFVLVKESDYVLRRLKKDENGPSCEVKCQVQCLQGQGQRKVIKESSKDIEKLEKTLSGL